MKRINIVCITLLMILLGVNTSCADYLDKAPDEDLTLDDVFTRENYAEQFLSSIYWNMPWELNFTNDWGGTIHSLVRQMSWIILIQIVLPTS